MAGWDTGLVQGKTRTAKASPFGDALAAQAQEHAYDQHAAGAVAGVVRDRTQLYLVRQRLVRLARTLVRHEGVVEGEHGRTAEAAFLHGQSQAIRNSR